MSKLRTAIQYLIENDPVVADRTHPLLSRCLETDGLNLFIEHCGHCITISQEGQTAMRAVIGAVLHRIDRDARGVPAKLYPVTRNAIDDAPAIVVIDPALSSGRPVIRGTGIATHIVAERYKAGETLSQLAKDYERSTTEIEEALRCELPLAA